MNKKAIEKFIKNNSLNIQEAKGSLMAVSYVYHSYVKMTEYYPIGFSQIFTVCRDGHVKQFLSQDELDRMTGRLLEEFLENRQKFNQRARLYRQSLRDMKKVSCQLRVGEWEKLSTKEIWNRFEIFSAEFKKFWQLVSIGEEKGVYAENHIFPQISKSKNATPNTHSLMLDMVQPDNISIFTQERIDYLELCLSPKRERQKIAERYARKYFWKCTDFFETRPIDLDQISAEADVYARQIGRRKISSELQKIKKEIQIRQMKKDLAEKKLKLNSREKALLRFVKIMGELADERKEFMMIGFYFFHQFLTVFAKRANVSYSQITCLISENELAKLIFGKKDIADIIKTREKGCLIIFNKNRAHPSVMDDPNGRWLESLADQKETGKALKGTVASTGGKKTVQGIARIILDPRQENFHKGEILVTSMTRVEFLPLMKKAKAIITNEGGITCHAAIVSRELGIPCVIGTKMATTFIKNGDIININLLDGSIN